MHLKKSSGVIIVEDSKGAYHIARNPKIRKGKYCPATITTPATTATATVSRSGDPPWKRGGLESSGRIASS